MKESINWDLIGRYMTGEISDEDRTVFKSWIESDPENQKIIGDLNEIWNEPGIEPPACNVDRMKNEILVKAGIRMENRQKTRFLPMLQNLRTQVVLRYAAAFLVFIMSAYFAADQFIFNGQSEYENLNNVVVANTLQDKITLPDGSIAILDAGTEFSYPREFAPDKREVFLQGEAFFEVVPGKDRPFLVNAGSAHIKVLGTKFNVRAWNITESVEVVVSEGNVLLRSQGDNGDNSVVIYKDQKSVIKSDSDPTVPVTVDPEMYTSWINNTRKFNNTRLKEVIDQLERWYDLKFDFKNKKLLSVNITIQIQKEEPVRDYIDLISSIINVKYEISDETVTFK